MNTQDIYQSITPIFRDVFDVEQLTLQADTTARDVPGWDSLNNIRLMMSIQRRFKLKFTAAEIGKLKNVGELVMLIQAKLPAAPAVVHS